ncbi:hypothetical protein FN976_08640 [Caenimonas sedimenti]|uniref:Uncharacterized protein n=1 Tax=Caenimonas sedimenti TaxID=2596921 RepID=A0A562ZSV4_9BURK|nr:hypothetical protein [Caenimonas sedimenti]TWO71670.1 hypothetical protein FN976_08640 [Caenimonas sedimenti]
MANEATMHLQHSESVVAQMAATIFSGLAQGQAAAALNDDELIERSLAIAIKMALRAEKLVNSDEEWVRKDRGSAYLAG